MIDFKRTEAEIALALIGRDNGIYLLPDQVVFGTPVQILGVRNTVVILTANTSSLFYGNKTIYYNRVSLNNLLANKNKTFNRNTSLKLSDLLPQINERFDLNLSKDQIVDSDLDHQSDSVVTLTLKPSNLVFIGSISLSVVNNIPPLTANFDGGELLISTSNILGQGNLTLRVAGGVPPYGYAWSENN